MVPISKAEGTARACQGLCPSALGVSSEADPDAEPAAGGGEAERLAGDGQELVEVGVAEAQVRGEGPGHVGGGAKGPGGGQAAGAVVQEVGVAAGDGELFAAEGGVAVVAVEERGGGVAEAFDVAAVGGEVAVEVGVGELVAVEHGGGPDRVGDAR